MPGQNEVFRNGRDTRMNERIAPPPRWHQLLEGRVGVEASWLLAKWPLLRLQLPRGRGPVLVLPGFLADDDSTWLLRRFLGELGYQAHPWELGVNRGPMLHYLPRLIERAATLGERFGELPSLVGWSRGGTLSRELARERPELIRSVVTLGSPVRGGVGGTSIGRVVSAQTGMTPEQMHRLLAERNRKPITTPVTAIYSKTDGVVAWQACIDDRHDHIEHVEVPGSHLGLGVNAAVYRIVARALAQHHRAPQR